MHFHTADYIFSSHTGFIPNGILVLNDDGSVADLLDPRKTNDLPEAKKYSGTLCPGFVNAHCHLELSHLRGKISKHTGFVGFAKELIPKRNSFSQNEIQQAIADAENEMLQNGIVAVGDISNTSDSFSQKVKGNLHYHTFIELLGLNPAFAEKIFQDGKLLQQKFHSSFSILHSSLTPHAPYSCSTELLDKISSSEKNLPLTIHNQESRAENEFFEKGTGLVRELYDFLKIDISFFKPPGKNSLHRTLPHLPKNRNVILVHNTFTSGEDIAFAENYSQKIYWCFCPNANLHIENTWPGFQSFADAKCKIVVGTDSLASNENLSVLDELKIISKNAPQISTADLLTWSTKNGADALNFSALGSFEKNKNPGVNLLKRVTPEKISQDANVEKLM